MHLCPPPYVPHIPYTSNSVFDQPNKICFKMQKIKVHIMQWSVAYSSARRLMQCRTSQRKIVSVTDEFNCRMKYSSELPVEMSTAM